MYLKNSHILFDKKRYMVVFHLVAELMLLWNIVC